MTTACSTKAHKTTPALTSPYTSLPVYTARQPPCFKAALRPQQAPCFRPCHQHWGSARSRELPRLAWQPDPSACSRHRPTPNPTPNRHTTTVPSTVLTKTQVGNTQKHASTVGPVAKHPHLFSLALTHTSSRPTAQIQPSCPKQTDSCHLLTGPTPILHSHFQEQQGSWPLPHPTTATQTRTSHPSMPQLMRAHD